MRDFQFPHGYDGEKLPFAGSLAYGCRVSGLCDSGPTPNYEDAERLADALSRLPDKVIEMKVEFAYGLRVQLRFDRPGKGEDHGETE